MQPLEKVLRSKLEHTVKEARDVAEAAARAALEQLGVGEADPFPHLSASECETRRKLRVHGRQLGDIRHEKNKTQDIVLLIEEVAYQHWHRMLFARFLAENDLLMYPDPDAPVAVTLEECEDLAADEGAANGWELAARFAARMLPQIFRPDSPVFQLTLPPEHQQRLERLVAELPQDVFTASDSLGWVYQFWQAKKKDAVNASEVKIGARELPAVTQLFTEPYMVAFLLDNSLGAWWAARRISRDDLQNATNEEELRTKASLPGVSLEYLRFVKPEGGVWTPAAGTFAGWPKHLSELKTLDPCCGSGHFLVAVFLMLVPMRMEMEGLSAREACDAVLRENIHGLELDQRCVALAAFALALAAWRYPDAGGYRPLPELNVACSGLAVSVAKDEWKQLGLGKKNLSIALDWMHDTFQDAPILGSLLNPAKIDAARITRWEELSQTLTQALKQEQSDEQYEAAVVAHGLAKAAQLLADRYTLIVTNVPYLARGKQSDTLREFCEQLYPTAKNDLATVFLDRCLEFTSPPNPLAINGEGGPGGTVAVVLPQNWLFLTSYRKFREKLLQNDTWHLIARLGEGGFESSAAAGAFTILIILSQGKTSPPTPLHEWRGGPEKEGPGRKGAGRGKSKPAQDTLFSPLSIHGEGNRGGEVISGLDVSAPRTATEKATELLSAEIKRVVQAKQLENPDARVALEESVEIELLSVYADGVKGISTNDDPVFVRCFWEKTKFDQDWEPYQSTTDQSVQWDGLHGSLRFEQGRGMMRILAQSQDRDRRMDMRGQFIVGKQGVAVSCMRELPIARYSGARFDTNVAMIVPHDPAHLPAIWCFCSSPEYNEAVRRIDQKLNVTNATLVKVPFDIDYWTGVAAERYPNGLPQPYSDDPTQWTFHGHPCGSVVWDEEAKWTAHGPLRTDETVLQGAVARLLGYRWPAELDAAMELSVESRTWVKKAEALLPYAENNGIVCIPPIRGEAPAVDRLLNLLAAAYGDAWSNDKLSELLKQSDHAGKTLETWLREKFFTQHCKLFQHRPFIWHIWDGLRDGFSALVNYHKLDHKNLEALTYTYLGDWITRQKQDKANKVDGAEEKLAAAEALKKKLEMILEGEAPYDIFVRWKPITQQPIGWNPDLNDGVRLNIRPFLTVPDVGKKGAGVLRDKPNINWNKDRGKDVESAPWYHLFNGNRINDHHLTLAEKRQVHEKHESHEKNE